MRFLDYIFYRSYQYERKKEKAGHKMATITSSGAVGVIIMSLTLWIWGFVIDNDYYPLGKYEIVIVGAFLYQFIPYIVYRNRTEMLNERYKKSPWNKRLSDFSIKLIIASSFYLGLAFFVFMQIKMSDL